MKKICFVTAARSEYGLLKWLMQEISQLSDCFQMQLVVTGSHLLSEQGHTIDQIVSDGFQIDEIVDIQCNTENEKEIAKSMGRMGEAFAEVFDRLEPEYIVVLGDRYELLPICNTAFMMRIPIIHISGGDVTTGALDNNIRNAVTMLSTYHFPGTAESAANIVRMRNSKQNIWAVGELGLDAFNKEKLYTRAELAENLHIKESSKWVLMTYHPETLETLKYNIEVVGNCFQVLKQLSDCQIVVTFSNADFGGDRINELIKKVSEEMPDKFIAIPSLGQRRYLSYMKQVAFVIGNSSSGIVEAPTLKIPVVNIGNRQKGRYQCGNIIQSDGSEGGIQTAVETVLHNRCSVIDSDYWGDGHTAEKIGSILKKLER